ncbi:MAG: TorF family putative porin [Gemmatimonadales bacterium]
MKRVKVFAALVLVAGLAVAPERAVAQAEIGAQLDLFSAYVWRGLSLTNKPVLQPDVWVSFPAGNASITVGGWSSIDVGRYDDLENDISESGAISSFNYAEFDPYAEVAFPVGKSTLTFGATAYIYPNDGDSPDIANDFGLLTSDANTVELYGKAGFDVLLSPEVSVYYDVDKIKGAYIEAAGSHDLPLSEKVGLSLGALVAFSAGQGISDDPDESSNFDDDGLTHLDFSAGLPLTAGVLEITPVLHLVVGVDDRVKVTSPTNTSDVKLWGGVSIGWSRTLGEAPEEEAEEATEAE